MCDFPSNEKGFLMEPPEWVARLPEEGIMTVGFIKLLRKGCAVYVPNDEEMWVSLKRKQSHCLTENTNVARTPRWPTAAPWTVTVLALLRCALYTSLKKSGARAKEE